MPASPEFLCLKVPLDRAACQGNQFPRVVELMAFQPEPRQLPLPLVFFDEPTLLEVMRLEKIAKTQHGLYGGALHNWIAGQAGMPRKEVKRYLQRGRDIELNSYMQVVQRLQIS